MYDKILGVIREKFTSDSGDEGDSFPTVLVASGGTGGLSQYNGTWTYTGSVHTINHIRYPVYANNDNSKYLQFLHSATEIDEYESIKDGWIIGNYDFPQTGDVSYNSFPFRINFFLHSYDSSSVLDGTTFYGGFLEEGLELTFSAAA